MRLIICLSLLLSSCLTTRPINFKYEAERCLVSVDFDKCRCHDYIITPSFSGRISDSFDRPLEYCNNFVGFSPLSWVELLNKLDSVLKKSTNLKTNRHEKGFDILDILN